MEFNLSNSSKNTFKQLLIVNHLNTINKLNKKWGLKQNEYTSYFLLFGVVLLILSGNGCGKRRPPVPPSVSRQTGNGDFVITQQGNKIAIKIPLGKQSNSRPSQIDVFRLAESTDSPLFLTEEEFASRSTQIGSLRLSTEANQKQAVFLDTIAPSAQPRRLRYAVRFVNADGRRSPFSNFAFFEPVRNAAKPAILPTPVATQTSINLRWQAPDENVDGSRPANILGYNVYRNSKGTDTPLKLNPSLLSETDFSDGNFQFNEQYEYFVRVVSAGVDGTQIESEDSNIAQIVPRDVFPPRAPEGLTIAAAPGNLSVFFAANAETDVIGYNIFRTTKPELPLQQWQKLNDALVKATSYQDTKVESGQKYYYYVAAVDSAENISQPSEIVSETAP